MLWSYRNASTRSLTQEDPIGLAGGLNLYGFAGGDPINFSDPFGLRGCDEDGDDGDKCSAFQELFEHLRKKVQNAKDDALRTVRSVAEYVADHVVVSHTVGFKSVSTNTLTGEETRSVSVGMPQVGGGFDAVVGNTDSEYSDIGVTIGLKHFLSVQFVFSEGRGLRNITFSTGLATPSLWVTFQGEYRKP